jgi:hypothetical protein
MDELDLILEETFFEAYRIDVRWETARLVVYHDGKEMTLKLSRYPMVVRGKLKLTSLEQLDNEQFVVVIQARQEEGQAIWK